MQNDVLATGVLSFVMHEIVYFGRSIPWMIVDRIPYFNKYKMQNVCSTYRAFEKPFGLLEIAKNSNYARTVEMRAIGAPVPLHS